MNSRGARWLLIAAVTLGAASSSAETAVYDFILSGIEADTFTVELGQDVDEISAVMLSVSGEVELGVHGCCYVDEYTGETDCGEYIDMPWILDFGFRSGDATASSYYGFSESGPFMIENYLIRSQASVCAVFAGRMVQVIIDPYLPETNYYDLCWHGSDSIVSRGYLNFDENRIRLTVVYNAQTPVEEESWGSVKSRYR